MLGEDNSMVTASISLMCLKEPDYIMSMMTTYGTLTTDGEVDRLRNYVENGNK